MRFKEFKFLIEDVTHAELEGMKKVIAAKIKDLPDSDETKKALKEIEELLSEIHAGGRKEQIFNQLEKINDPAVLAAQKQLARYIVSLSLDHSPETRKEFFKLWSDNLIVNVPALLSKERVPFSAVFENYDSNMMLQEFVNDVMEISELGQGRGEFGLSVLSRDIWAPPDGKGDLQMTAVGALRRRFKKPVLKIECKTTFGGAARFSDQEVRPAEGFEAAAVELNSFVRKNKTYPIKISAGYGVNINQAIDFYQNIKPADQATFIKLVSKAVTLIFGGREANVEDVKAIVAGIKLGDSGTALQAWANANFNYYMSKKEDDGVLYIDLVNREFVFYTEASDLASQGLRFEAETTYISGTKDPGRAVYPKIKVVPTTFGANVAAKTIPKQKKRNPVPDFDQRMVNWARAFANRRKVVDPKIIKAMADSAKQLLANDYDSHSIILQLEKQFPVLQVKVSKPKIKLKPQAPVQQAPVQQPQAQQPIAPQPVV